MSDRKKDSYDHGRMPDRGEIIGEVISELVTCPDCGTRHYKDQPHECKSKKAD